MTEIRPDSRPDFTWPDDVGFTDETTPTESVLRDLHHPEDADDPDLEDFEEETMGEILLDFLAGGVIAAAAYALGLATGLWF